MDTQEKYNLFKKLHVKGNPLILYNIWNAGSAEAVVSSGAKVVATGSKPLAIAQGYPDGEAISFEKLIDTIQSITNVIDVPVSVDFEAGYSNSNINLLKENTVRLLETGIIGVNFEDHIINTGKLYAADEQANRINTIRKSADENASPLFINARTDLFLLEKDKAKHKSLIPEAMSRAKEYEAAGANGFFAPGLDNETLIQDLCDAVNVPVNIVKIPTAPNNITLAKLGVSRISYGPFAYLGLMNELKKRAQAANESISNKNFNE